MESSALRLEASHLNLLSLRIPICEMGNTTSIYGRVVIKDNVFAAFNRKLEDSINESQRKKQLNKGLPVPTHIK